MAQFPTLKTGAVAQYPSERSQQNATHAYRFVDGSEQRFPASGSGLRRWTIRLELLDEAELATLEDFFASAKGRAGEFEFTDPWDGTVFQRCSFDQDGLAEEFLGAARGKTSFVVKENR